MNNFKHHLWILCLGVAVANPALSNNDSVILADFESGSIRIVNPKATTPTTRFLFNQYEGDPTQGPDIGSETVTNEDSLSGNYSLKITIDSGDITSGSIYTQFYPKVSSLVWENMSTQIETGTWTKDKYNRMRFWMKLPPGMAFAPPGQTNLHFGTYVRASNGDKSSAESGGNHFYHYFNVESTGVWHQFIIDTHPTHARGNSGGTEEGNREYPTGEAGYNYFDALTRFYVDARNGLPNYPAYYYLDKFEFYEETNLENIDQIYSLNAVYEPNKNKLTVGWNRDKNENSVKHEVKYSFTDIHSTGWDAATSAPNGIITPPGWQGYNRMRWSTSSIDLTGKVSIYIGIKPENSSLFRQIKIPVTGVTGTTPKPPSMLNIQ
ncbi:hypothetical protein MNBD_GAMMA09-3535 [hydrothermal vent metagenome]|uniref:Uncharacterized protein n=1 Tax=hydrothermal vent metagenome TaxID=652676 RepID=A0A3B0XIV9_9ZZZZ